ncbi:MAG TPA: DMT family transporter [Streptosporangiales bacterium]
MHRRALDAALAAGFVLSWSSGFVGAELGSRTAPATTLLTWRFLLSAVLLGAAVLLRGRSGRGARARGVAGQAVVGLLAQGGYLAGVVGAVQLGVPAAVTALVAALQPLVAGALARPVLGERVRARQWLGLGAGFGGVALVVAGGITAPRGTPGWAYALPFAGMLSLVAATLLDRRLAAPMPLTGGLAVQTAASGVVFVAIAAPTGTLLPPADTTFWLAVAWTVLLSGIGGYGTYWLAARRVGVTRLNALLYLTPPTTAVWAYAMFGQPIGVLTVAGMAVCALTVPLAYTRRRAEALAPAPCGEVVGGGS